jgi:hypothetical protein
MSEKGPSKQMINGKAFEWAVAVAISQHTGFVIRHSQATKLAAYCFTQISAGVQARFQRNAKSAIEHILGIESMLISKHGFVRLNDDQAGQQGDVRDVIIECAGTEIGISCKTNHTALKHSRLSGSADFVKQWGLDDAGCSDQYWSKIRPLFEELAEYRMGKVEWKKVPDVPKRFYWPILNAFADELQRLRVDESREKVLCQSFIRYLIGSHDFYKVISRSREVQIQAYNLNGTLSVPRSPMPKGIVGIDDRNGGQYSKTVRFESGYTINFRIHSAATIVEASLKFDVTAIGLPQKLYTNTLSFIK